MKSLCFYFQVHQPYRVKKYRSSTSATTRNISTIAVRRSQQSPRRREGRRNIHPGDEPASRHAQEASAVAHLVFILRHRARTIGALPPEALDLFKKVVDTGQVEVLGETIITRFILLLAAEFERQVAQHRDLIRRLFGVWPRSFRNTELSYRNDLATWADKEGYAAILAEGWDPILGWRSPITSIARRVRKISSCF